LQILGVIATAQISQFQYRSCRMGYAFFIDSRWGTPYADYLDPVTSKDTLWPTYGGSFV